MSLLAVLVLWTLASFLAAPAIGRFLARNLQEA